MNKIPVVIIGCNRPNYLIQCIDSLRNQVEDREVFLFLDSPSKGESYHNYQAEILQHKLHKKCKSLSITKRASHLGVGNNMIGVRQWAFETRKFNYCHFIEDDAVLSPYALQLTENILNWVHEHKYDNVGAIQTWKREEWDPDGAEANANNIEYTHANWFQYLMSRSCWMDIRDLIYQYQNRFINHLPYMSRNHQTIYSWYQTLADNPVPNQFQNPFPANKDTTRIFREKFYSSQDHSIMYAMLNRGWSKIGTSITRAQTIGKNGMHCTPQSFKAAGFEDVVPFISEEDKDRKEFIIV